jgi:hypothetical protein
VENDLRWRFIVIIYLFIVKGIKCSVKNVAIMLTKKQS